MYPTCGYLMISVFNLYETIKALTNDWGSLEIRRKKFGEILRMVEVMKEIWVSYLENNHSARLTYNMEN
jgi:hypothetical protein